MTYKTIAIIVIFTLLFVLNNFNDLTGNSKINQINATLNTYLKTQKTLVGSNGDALEYTYQQVGKTCYEDVRNGQVISLHCN